MTLPLERKGVTNKPDKKRLLKLLINSLKVGLG